MKEKQAGRLLWLDVLKGVGILAVVVGHVWTRGPLRDAIYAFHMPLFFLASGYMLRPMPMGALAPRLLRSLAVPFACFSLLLVGADMLIEGLRGMRPIFGSWREAVGTILFWTERTRGPFTILWFVPALLLARLAWNGLALRFPRPAAWPWLLVASVCCGLSALLPHLTTHSPLGLLAVPAALLLLWLGTLWRTEEAHVYAPRMALPLGMLGLAALTLLPPLNMKLGEMGWPAVSLLGAAGVSLWLAILLRHLPDAVVGPFAWLGRISLVIMYVHVAFIHYLAPYAPRWSLVFVALLGSACIDWLARQTPLGRRLLLGERG